MMPEGEDGDDIVSSSPPTSSDDNSTPASTTASTTCEQVLVRLERTPTSIWYLNPAGSWRMFHIWNPLVAGGAERTVVLGPGDTESTWTPPGTGGSGAVILNPTCASEGRAMWDEGQATHPPITLNEFWSLYRASAPAAPAGGGSSTPSYTPPPPAPNPPAPSQPTQPPAPAQPQCNSWNETHSAAYGTPWTINPAYPAVANVHSVEVDPNFPTRKVWIPAGGSFSLPAGGGDITYWPAECEEVAWENYVANGNIVFDWDEFQSWVDKHREPASPQEEPESEPEATCGPSQSYGTGEPGTFTVQGPAIANVWTNASGEDQTEFKTLIPHGVSVSFRQVGGTIWPFDVGCSEQHLLDNFHNNGLPARDISDWRARGLAD